LSDKEHVPKKVIVFTVGIQGTYREFLDNNSEKLNSLQEVFGDKKFGY